MDNAPKRLRINGNVIDDIDGDFTGKLLCLSSGAEYIRADLHDATKAQLAKAVVALRITLEWMETMRACGDAGNWEWGDGDEYTTARAVLAEIEKCAS